MADDRVIRIDGRPKTRRVTQRGESIPLRGPAKAKHKPGDGTTPRREVTMADAEPIPVERPLEFNEWRTPFLKHLRVSGNITAAARLVRVSRALVVRMREESSSFDQACTEAIAEAGDMLEALAIDRARKGSDFLLWRLLQGALPEKYGQKSTVTHKFDEEDRRKVYADARAQGLTDSEAQDAVAEVEKIIREQQRGKR